MNRFRPDAESDPHKPGWTLTFNDEFDGEKLRHRRHDSRWRHREGRKNRTVKRDRNEHRVPQPAAMVEGMLVVPTDELAVQCSSSVTIPRRVAPARRAAAIALTTRP